MTDVSLASPDKTMVALSHHGIYAFRVRGGKSARMPIGDVTRWLDYPGYEGMFAAGAAHNLALSFLMGLDDLPDSGSDVHPFPTRNPCDSGSYVCGVRIRDGVFPEEDLKTLCNMARHKRVMVKLGPFQALGDGQAPYLDLLPLIRRIVDAFGPAVTVYVGK